MKVLIILLLSIAVIEALHNPEAEFPQPASPLASQMADEAVRQTGADPYEAEPTVIVERLKRSSLVGEITPPTDAVVVDRETPLKDNVRANYARFLRM